MTERLRSPDTRRERKHGFFVLFYQLVTLRRLKLINDHHDYNPGVMIMIRSHLSPPLPHTDNTLSPGH